MAYRYGPVDRLAVASGCAERALPHDVVLPGVPDVEVLAPDRLEAVTGVEGVGTGVLLADPQPGPSGPGRVGRCEGVLHQEPGRSRAVVRRVDVEAPELDGGTVADRARDVRVCRLLE